MTFEEVLSYLNARDNFILTAHESPDADAVGAEYAACRLLSQAGKRSRIINAVHPAQKFRFIDDSGILESAAVPGTLESVVRPFNLVVFDTNDLYHLGSLSDSFIQEAETIVVIDHHEIQNAPANAYIDSKASSTCEMVYNIARALSLTIPPDVADALFAGIVYDTGSFIYPKTSAKTFAAGLDLVRLGVVPYSIHSQMFESSTVQSLLLQKMVLGTLEFRLGGNVAVMAMSLSSIKDSGASYEDAESLINIPLQAKTVKVSILLKENPDGSLRCSFRSKGEVNVAKIAQEWGGGGHKTAAGFRSAFDLEKTRKDVLDRFKREFPDTLD